MNNVISNILENIPERTDVTINYYDACTINYFNLDSPIGVQESINRVTPNNNTPSINRVTPNNNTPPLNTSAIPQNNRNADDTEEINVSISRENVFEPFTTTQINATIDYSSDLESINNVMNFTDVLTNSIANSLENINIINPRNVSTYDMLEKTTLIIYKDIEDPEDKCHICNEAYNDFDICRKNNLCSHYFHHKCIDNWYTRNVKCPICQQVI